MWFQHIAYLDNFTEDFEIRPSWEDNFAQHKTETTIDTMHFNWDS